MDEIKSHENEERRLFLSGIDLNKYQDHISWISCVDPNFSNIAPKCYIINVYKDPLQSPGHIVYIAALAPAWLKKKSHSGGVGGEGVILP